MDATRFVERILDDEGIAAGLDEAGATALVTGLVAKVEAAVAVAKSETEAAAKADAIRKLGRGIAKVVVAWRDDSPGKAAAVAKTIGLPAPAAKTIPELISQLLASV